MCSKRQTFVCFDCGQLWKLLHMRTCRYWVEKSKVVVKWQCKLAGKARNCKVK